MSSLSALNTPATLLRSATEVAPAIGPYRPDVSALKLTSTPAATVVIGAGAGSSTDLGTRPNPDDLVAGTLVREQTVASSEWRGSHPFGRLPDVTVYVDGEQVDTFVHVTESSYVIAWPQPMTGTAHLR